MKGKDLFLKPNFNSADAPPGSTHRRLIHGWRTRRRKRAAGKAGSLSLFPRCFFFSAEHPVLVSPGPVALYRTLCPGVKGPRAVQ